MLTANIDDVIAELGAMVMRMHENGPFLEAIGERETERVQERIRDTKLDPSGYPWAPWAPSTLWDRQFKGNVERGLLFDEGDLLMSIHPSVQAVANTVEIGSNMDYAAYLQNGTDKMPERPFLGWESESLPVYENLFIRYVETGVL